jgi:RNA polymerase sigma factor (sigma-70 family)
MENPDPQPVTADDAAPEHFYPALYRYLVRKIKGIEDAQDLAQTTYLRFLQAPNLAAIRQPQAYLYRIAANVVSEFRLLRRRSELVTYDSQLAQEHAERADDLPMDQAADDLYSDQLFRQVVNGLPVTHRAVLILFVQEGLSIEQIGQRLGIGVLTTRKYLRQALVRLRATREDR